MITTRYRFTNPWFVGLVLAALFFFLARQVLNYDLRTGPAPNGLFSLQYANNPDRAAVILQSWAQHPKGDQLAAARRAVWLDFPLTLSYGAVLFIICLYFHRYWKRQGRPWGVRLGRLAMGLVVLAFIFSVIRDGIVLRFLQGGGNLSPDAFSWMSRLSGYKTAALLIAGFYGVYDFSIRYRKEALLTTRILWYSRFSVLIVAVLFVLLWLVPQGQDLLVSINENPTHVAALFIATSVVAGVVWFMPRYFFPVNRKDRDRQILADAWEDHRQLPNRLFYLKIPRLLGVLTILVVFGAFRNILFLTDCPFFREAAFWPELTKIPPFYQLILAFSIFLLPIPEPWMNRLVSWYDTGPGRFRINGALMVIGVLLAAVVAFYFVDTQVFRSNPKGMHLLSLSAFLLAVVFYIGAVCRRKINYTRHGLKAIANFKVFRLLRVCLIAGFLVVLSVNSFAPQLAIYTGAISMIMIILTLLLLAIVALSFFYYRTPGTVLFFVALIVGTAFYIARKKDNHYHDVETMALPESFDRNRRMTVPAYFRSWVFDRAPDIRRFAEAGRRYPVFLVASSGGGTRAAYWTALISATLQDSTDGQFGAHLFSMSGASGGSVGSAVFTGLRAELGNGTEYTQRVEQLFQRDFLSVGLVYMFGKGLVQSLIPLDIGSWQDRSEWLADVYRRGFREATGGEALGGPVEMLWYPEGRIRTQLPLYFGHATQVEDGRRALLSPVKLDGVFTDAVDVLGGMPSGKTLSLATAAMMTNRFPYINPAGKLNGMHYLDGGFFDNSGSLATMELLDVLADTTAAANEQDSAFLALHRHLAFYAVKIDNDQSVHQAMRVDRIAREESEEVPELTAPFKAAYNAMLNGHVRLADTLLRQHPAVAEYIHFWVPYRGTYRDPNCGCEVSGHDEFRQQYCTQASCSEILPLGRNLSENTKEALRVKIRCHRPVIQRIKAMVRLDASPCELEVGCEGLME